MGEKTRRTRGLNRTHRCCRGEGAGVLKVGPRSWHSNRFIFQAKRYRGETRWKQNSGMPAEVLENETLTVDCDEKIENASTFDPSNPSNEDKAHPSQFCHSRPDSVTDLFLVSPKRQECLNLDDNTDSYLIT